MTATAATPRAAVVEHRRTGMAFPTIAALYGKTGAWAWAIVKKAEPSLTGQRRATVTKATAERATRTTRQSYSVFPYEYRCWCGGLDLIVNDERESAEKERLMKAHSASRADHRREPAKKKGGE